MFSKYLVCPPGALSYVDTVMGLEWRRDGSHIANPSFRAGVDKNNNGTIDFREFIGALSITSRGNLDEKLQCKSLLQKIMRGTGSKLIFARIWITGAFQLYDINNDGLITYDEMLQIVQSIYDMTGDMVKLPADEDTATKVGRSLQLSSRSRNGC